MNKLSLNAKMYLIVGELCLACLIVTFFAYRAISSTQKSATDLVNVDSVAKDRWARLSRLDLILALKEREFYTQADAGKREQIGAEIDDLKKKIDGLIESVESTQGTSADLTSFKDAFRNWWVGHQQVRILGNKGDVAGAREAFNQTKPYRETLLKISGTQAEELEAAMAAKALEASQKSSDAKFSMLMYAIIALIVAAFLAWRILRQIRITTGAIVDSLSSNADRIGATAVEFAESSNRLAGATTEQSASLQETAASTQELTAIVHRNRENAETASSATQKSQQSAKAGQAVVNDMSAAIEDINASNQDIMKQIDESNGKVSEVTTIISEIATRTRVINDIVFQTKLLSFNASVEAERAGEHGRGFAVVAEEIGNLARMSGIAAKEIATMLDDSAAKVDGIVGETRSQVETLVAVGRSKVERGTEITARCSEILQEIVRSIAEVSRMSTDIASASQEQAQGVQEINRAMSQLDGVTQINATASAVASEAAKDLENQARSLQKSVTDLVVLVNGSVAQ